MGFVGFFAYDLSYSAKTWQSSETDDGWRRREESE
jgi:hypothetical protein